MTTFTTARSYKVARIFSKFVLTTAFLFFVTLPTIPVVAQSQVYNHPLLSTDAQAQIEAYFNENPEASAEHFLRDHMIVTGIRITAEGATGQSLSGVIPVRRTPIFGHIPSREPPAPQLSVGPTLQQWLDEPGIQPTGTIALSVGILPGWHSIATATHGRAIAMVQGKVHSKEDARAIRAAIIQGRKQAGIAALGPLQNAVNTLGGEVIRQAPSAGTMDIRLPASKITTLMEHPDLGRIEVTIADSDDAGHAYNVDGVKIDGRELEDLIQSTQYYNNGYFGIPDESIALVETNGHNVYKRHQGFGGRFVNCNDNGLGACGWADPAVGTAHSTAVASILLGDITNMEDPAITTDLAQRERSGIARGSLGRGFTGADFQFLSDRLFAYNDTHILTRSSSANNDPSCRGETVLSRNWNSLYEDGYALFNSAGNNGHTNPNDCVVAAPATAIGVFSVGAYVVNAADNEAIYANSDQGGNGTVSEGRHRTVIDIIAPSRFEYGYPHFAWPVDPAGTPFQYGVDWGNAATRGPAGFCCTSAATPAVAGSAALFRHWWSDVHGAAIDDPGLLYTNLLLMGDRRQEAPFANNLYQNSGFNGLWGAGKLRLRKFDMAGLDGPAIWSSGSACVDDGTVVTIDMGNMSSDVEIINAVLWWYDRRHDDGIHHDNIDLRLQRDTGGGNWQTVGKSLTKDNKERVALESPTSGFYRMRIRGKHVTADNEGCGNNSNHVYWAFVAEDSDREAWEALDDVRPYPTDPVLNPIIP